MGASFSKVIDNMKPKTKTKTNLEPLIDDNDSEKQFIFVIEDDVVSIEPILKIEAKEEKEEEKEKEVIPMDIKELMRVIIAEVLLEETSAETLIEETVIEETSEETLIEETLIESEEPLVEPLTKEPTKTVSDRKLRKRRKKSL